MKTWRELRIEETIKKHDPLLFLNRNYKGELQIMRKSKQFVTHDFNGFSVEVLTPAPHYIMSLTEDWTSRTNPVDWGLDPIIRRLQEIDGWAAESAWERIKRANDALDEQKQKSFNSLSEDVAREWQKEFKKHTSEILTHSMEKKDPRQKGDRKYGYRKS